MFYILLLFVTMVQCAGREHYKSTVLVTVIEATPKYLSLVGTGFSGSQLSVAQ